MLPSHMPDEVRHVIKIYVLAAGVTRAVPLPGSSLAIKAETAAMLAKIAAATGRPIDIHLLIRALGLAGSVNVFGRQVFVEFAHAISWDRERDPRFNID